MKEWAYQKILTDEDMEQQLTRHRLSGTRLKAKLKRAGRDISTCEVYKNKVGKRKTTIHHLDENPKNNKSENLLVLCSSCHSKFHKKRLYVNPVVEQAIKGFWRVKNLENDTT